MSVRAVPVVLACSSLLVIAAACSADTETDGGSIVTSAGAEAGAEGDEATVGAGGLAHASGAGGAPGDLTVAGAPDGGVAGASGGGGAPVPGGAAGAAGAAGACNVVVSEHALASGVHVTACSDILYATNPPSSGAHYPTWADYGVYDFELPRGYWVHNLEHGSVVVSYHCEAGCAEELAAAKAWLAALEPDAQCAGQTPRVLLVPDPLLDVRWAASAWGWTLRADCFDAEAFLDFYASHAGKPPAPEAMVCTTGTDLRTSSACGANE